MRELGPSSTSVAVVSEDTLASVLALDREALLRRVGGGSKPIDPPAAAFSADGSLEGWVLAQGATAILGFVRATGEPGLRFDLRGKSRPSAGPIAIDDGVAVVRAGRSLFFLRVCAPRAANP
jgi:hypothetical protein